MAEGWRHMHGAFRGVSVCLFVWFPEGAAGEVLVAGGEYIGPWEVVHDMGNGRIAARSLGRDRRIEFILICTP